MDESPVTILTGAGSGIGRAAAELLAAGGHRLVLVGRTASKLNETRSKLIDSGAHGDSCMLHTADMADPDDVQSIVAGAVEAFGRIDNIINNAAVGEFVPIERTDTDLLDRTFRANVYGPALLIRHAWPIFRRQHTGCVVNVSSMAAIDPFPTLAVYAASKCALESLTRSIMNEGGALGMRAFSIAPGAVETDMLRAGISTDMLPPEKALAPSDVACIIADCVEGRREADVGRQIVVPSPS